VEVTRGGGTFKVMGRGNGELEQNAK